MARQPDDSVSLRREIDDLKAALRRLTSRSPFYGTGVHPNGLGGLDSDTYVAGASGFSLNGLTGTPEFNDLKLRGGIIGNDALTNPVVPQYVYDYTSNFAVVGGTMTHVRRTTVTVPPGVTSAIVNVTARIYAVNDTAGLDYLYCQANIAGYNGLALPVPASGSNGSAMNVSAFASTLPGLTPGSTFTVDIDAMSAFGGWSANASNQADISGTILWFR